MMSDFVEWFTLRKKSTLTLVMQDYENSTVACWERTMSEHNFHYMKGSFEGNSFNGEA